MEKSLFEFVMDKSVEDRFKVELQKKHNVLKKVMTMPNDEYFKTIERSKVICKQTKSTSNTDLFAEQI